MQLIEIPSPDGSGSFQAQFALPAKTPAPGIVIVPHIGGIAPDMGEWADRYAEKGFVAIVPDVFWRVHPGPTGSTDEGRRLARERAQKVDVDDCVRDIRTTMEYLAARKECTGRIGVIGFCFGGLYAYLASTRLGVTEAASFHGVGIGGFLAEAGRVSGDLSLHFGDSDPVVPMSEVAAIQSALGGNSRVSISVYEGAEHNFTAVGRPSYQPDAATLSDERSGAVLARLF